MGPRPPAARAPARELRLPRGVTLRRFGSEQHPELRIQIAFTYRGTECRELLPPQPVTQTALDHAGGLRAEIRRRIAAGSFAYAEYFPASPRAALFGGRAGQGPRVRMRTLLDNQLEAYRRQAANGTISRSTLAGYEKALTGVRMQHWHEMWVDEVTPAALRQWIGALGITAKAARNLLTPLRSVFEDALNDEIIDANPFNRIALAKLLRQTTKASDYEVDPFTAAERAELVAAARPDEAPMLRFWLATGLRPGELMALRWRHVSLAERTARIELNLVAGAEKGPKTAAGVRDVDLPDDAIAALIAQKPATAGEGGPGHVWVNPRDGTPWRTDSQLRKVFWVPLLERSGVRYRNPYQVRHTYASAALTEGANPWYLAEQLGHVDPEMVFRTYGKFIREDWRKPAAKAAAQLKVVK